MTATALLLLLATLPAAAPPAGREPPVVAGVRAATDGPPPAALADPRGEPGPGETWIDGHWQWTGRWSWVRGQWATPPGPGYAWVPALWTSDDRGFTFHEPFWRPPMRPAEVHAPPSVAHPFVRTAPPPLLVEVRGPPPGPDAVWIPGFWSWAGQRWAWVVGTWSAPVKGASWVEGHWKAEGGGFRWVPGRWRRG